MNTEHLKVIEVSSPGPFPLLLIKPTMTRFSTFISDGYNSDQHHSWDRYPLYMDRFHHMRVYPYALPYRDYNHRDTPWRLVLRSLLDRCAFPVAIVPLRDGSTSAPIPAQVIHPGSAAPDPTDVTIASAVIDLGPKPSPT